MMFTVGKIKSIGNEYGFIYAPSQSPRGWDGSRDFHFKVGFFRRMFLQSNLKVFFFPYRSSCESSNWRARLVLPIWMAWILLGILIISLAIMMFII